MAKARTKDSVKIRAIKAWAKATPTENATVSIVECWKSRSKQTVTVREKSSGSVMVWSYKGGNLRRLGKGEAAGQTGLSACISGEYA